MYGKIIGMAAAMGMILGSAAALAQPKVGDGSNSPTPTPQYDIAGGAAHLGDGSDPNFHKDNKALQLSPGYTSGTASAKKNPTTTH